jgi:hypothetical protein
MHLAALPLPTLPEITRILLAGQRLYRETKSRTIPDTTSAASAAPESATSETDSMGAASWVSWGNSGTITTEGSTNGEEGRARAAR